MTSIVTRGRGRAAAWAFALTLCGSASAQTLLNGSYDVAREFYQDYNAAFVAHYAKTTGQQVKVQQSHGASSAVARLVAQGMPADVVTMNTVSDVDYLVQEGVVQPQWAQRFANNASPTTSTMLFLVRQGNPKHIKDWDDLVKPGVRVVVVNPKTGGNGRYAYMAAWGYAKTQGATDAQAAQFVGKLYKNVPELSQGGRDATDAFLLRQTGDVLITFESEVLMVNREFGEGRVQTVYPSVSIVAENPVAVVERTVASKGSAALAQAYLDYLYSDAGQEIAARHALRPRSAAMLVKYAHTFKPLKLFTVQDIFGSLQQAQQVHFSEGGQFDQLHALK